MTDKTAPRRLQNPAYRPSALLFFEKNNKTYTQAIPKDMIHVILADGFEEIEAITVIDILRRCNLDVQTVSISGKRLVTGAHNLPFMVDAVFRFSSIGESDCIVLPGGMPGAENLATCQHLRRALLKQDAANKLIAAICAAPMVLGRHGILRDRKATCYPGFEHYLPEGAYTGEPVTQDTNIITAFGPAAATDFAFAIARRLVPDEVVNKVRQGMLFD